jgi:glycosyltransferase involved in cell wall biosynthesis
MSLKAQKAMFRKKYGFSDDKFSFVFVSASHRRKGLPLAIRAFEQLRDANIELIVAGTPVKMKLPDNIRYIGYVKSSEELFAAADGLLLPATYEPFGQIVSEAVLCGTPVLLSPMVGAGEIISENEGVIVPTFETADWVSAIREFPTRQFHMAPDFAQRHRLQLSDHIEAILKIAEHRA